MDAGAGVEAPRFQSDTKVINESYQVDPQPELWGEVSGGGKADSALGA